MAIIRFENGTTETVTAAAGAKIWEVMNLEREPTEAEDAYCVRVKAVYLNWRNAPDSYIKKHFGIICNKAISDWFVDAQGNVTKPSDDFGWKFAKRWGLWENGRKTSVVQKYARSSR